MRTRIDLSALLGGILLSALSMAPCFSRGEGTVSAERMPGRSYALIVNGGKDRNANHLSFWGDTALAYNLFRGTYGLPRGNIRVLWASGEPGSDLCVVGSACANCLKLGAKLPRDPKDFDRDGTDDIDGPATLETIRATFEWFRERLTAADRLTVFFTDHGTSYEKDPCAKTARAPFACVRLWGGDLLTDALLRNLTKDIACPIIVAMQCCYSGGIIDDLLDSESPRFITTANDFRPALLGSKIPWYDQWSYYFLSALRGYYPKDGQNPHLAGKACDADENGDGKTDLFEAARLAYLKRPGNNTPQYGESFAGLGRVLDPVSDGRAIQWTPCATVVRSNAVKTHQLKLSADVSVVSGPTERIGALLTGERIRLSVPRTTTDKRGGMQVFRRWSVTPATEDLGVGFDSESPDVELTMPATRLTLKPVYVAESKVCRLTQYAEGESFELLASGRRIAPSAGESPCGSFFWSPDSGSTWYRNGHTAVLSPGTYTVTWRSRLEGWAAPSAKKKFRLAAGDDVDNALSPAFFPHVPAVCADVVLAVGGSLLDDASGGTVTLSPLDGRIKPGKSVTLKAKAKKDHVFVGWCPKCRMGDGLSGAVAWSRSASLKLSSVDLRELDDGDLAFHYVAVFRPLADYDSSSVDSVFTGLCNAEGQARTISRGADFDSISLYGVTGCPLRYELTPSDSWVPVVFSKTAGKLPAGVKFDAKAGVITGTPTARNGQRTSFTITASDPARHSRILRVDFTVKPLPEWAVGDYRALLARDGLADAFAEFSLTAAGKASGKILRPGGPTSITPKLEWIEPECGESDGTDVDGTLALDVEKITKKSTGERIRFRCELAHTGGRTVRYETYSGLEWSTWTGEALRIDAALLADKGFKAGLFGNYYTASLVPAEWQGDATPAGCRNPVELLASGYLTLTTDGKGGVKVAGKLPDATSVSFSGKLIPMDADRAILQMFVAPSAYKKDGYLTLTLDLSSDGGISASGGIWRLPPKRKAALSPDDDGVLPGLLSVDAIGRRYLSSTNLKASFVRAGEPTTSLELEYGYSGANGKKTYGLTAALGLDFSGKVSLTRSTGVFGGTAKAEFAYWLPKFNRKGEDVGSWKHSTLSVPFAGVLIADGEGGCRGIGSGRCKMAFKDPFAYEEIALIPVWLEVR